MFYMKNSHNDFQQSSVFPAMITEITAWDEEPEIAMFEISYYLRGRVFRFQQLQHRAKKLKMYICRNVSSAIKQRQRCDMPQFNGSEGNEKPENQNI